LRTPLIVYQVFKLKQFFIKICLFVSLLLVCLGICKSLVVVLEHRKVSCLCAWALEISCLCAWVLVIWDYIVSEISLEVQGGQDYFRFVEGTCIIALCLSSLSLSLCFYPLHIKSLITTSEADCHLLLNCDISRSNKEKANTIQPPLLVFFSPSCLYFQFVYVDYDWCEANP